MAWQAGFAMVRVSVPSMTQRSRGWAILQHLDGNRQRDLSRRVRRPAATRCCIGRSRFERRVNKRAADSFHSQLRNERQRRSAVIVRLRL